ncbi:hypothetical protein Patl1_34643 [Pistacia atlantica]|uniref:Uncharacterized protein n=1 Tax=Pistacia atlantica TaxID=434234 RepID=A0ACC0ZQ51_9ROSI|nr:hypothetical protein Patl1_34643 [Pistacia atlantica]
MATNKNSSSSSTRTCLCAPTTHPGSFRCSLHRGPRKFSTKSSSTCAHSTESRSKMPLNIIKPSSHDLQRRRNFQPKPTRFCQMKTGYFHNGVSVS